MGYKTVNGLMSYMANRIDKAIETNRHLAVCAYLDSFGGVSAEQARLRAFGSEIREDSTIDRTGTNHVLSKYLSGEHDADSFLVSIGAGGCKQWHEWYANALASTPEDSCANPRMRGKQA